ncbi:hypothetical protein [Halorussus halophilus]|uniref:hypothetical protein n=1 Tax=Halorussus halophilus TaxID=2650975 RepID=UPI0013013241|nr:hypothetical protein [Halorussus halophilus]
MDRSAHHRLRSHLQERVGSALRSIVFYDAETKRVIYLRDDAQENISSVQAEGLIEYLREREDIQQARERLGLDTGLQCTVHCWQDRTGLHFPHSPQSGTLVTVSTTVTNELNAFVAECTEILE